MHSKKIPVQCKIVLPRSEPVVLWRTGTEAKGKTILSYEEPVDKLKDYAMILVTKLVTILPEIGSPGVVVVFKCGPMEIEQGPANLT